MMSGGPAGEGRDVPRQVPDSRPTAGIQVIAGRRQRAGRQSHRRETRQRGPRPPNLHPARGQVADIENAYRPENGQHHGRRRRVGAARVERAERRRHRAVPEAHEPPQRQDRRHECRGGQCEPGHPTLRRRVPRARAESGLRVRPQPSRGEQRHGAPGIGLAQEHRGQHRPPPAA